MTRVDALDLAAAAFRDRAERLARLADELEHAAEEERAFVEAEIDATLDGLGDSYRDAQDASLTAHAWQMEVDWRGEQDELPNRAAEREHEAMEDVIADYRSGSEALEEARPVLEDHGYDIGFVIGDDTQIYDHEEHVDDLEFDMEFDGGIYRVIDAVDTVYETASELYDRFN